MNENVVKELVNERNKVISKIQLAIKNNQNLIMTYHDFDLLLFNVRALVNECTYDEEILIKLYKNLVRRRKQKIEIQSDIYMQDDILLLAEMGEKMEEVTQNAKKYFEIVERSKDVFGINFSAAELKELLVIVNKYKPDYFEEKELYEILNSSYSDNQIIDFSSGKRIK